MTASRYSAAANAIALRSSNWPFLLAAFLVVALSACSQAEDGYEIAAYDIGMEDKEYRPGDVLEVRDLEGSTLNLRSVSDFGTLVRSSSSLVPGDQVQILSSKKAIAAVDGENHKFVRVRVLSGTTTFAGKKGYLSVRYLMHVEEEDDFIGAAGNTEENTERNFERNIKPTRTLADQLIDYWSKKGPVQPAGQTNPGAAGGGSNVSSVADSGTGAGNATPPAPAGNYSYELIFKSRDEISGFDSLRNSKKNVIALDFNKVLKKTKVLVVIPNNVSSEFAEASRSFINAVSKKYNRQPLGKGRHGAGIKTTSENGRGLSNITHTEAFDGNDKELVDRIQNNPREYAQILADTYGKVPNTVFIAPHTKRAQGADTYKGVSERAFALKYILPALKAIRDGGSGTAGMTLAGAE